MSLINNSNLTPATLYGKGDNGNVSMQVSPTGIILGGDLNTATPITATISQAGIITDNPNGFNILSSLNMNSQNITDTNQLSSPSGNDITINSSSQINLLSYDNVNINPGVNLIVNSTDSIILNANGGSANAILLNAPSTNILETTQLVSLIDGANNGYINLDMRTTTDQIPTLELQKDGLVASISKNNDLFITTDQGLQMNCLKEMVVSSATNNIRLYNPSGGVYIDKNIGASDGNITAGEMYANSFTGSLIGNASTASISSSSNSVFCNNTSANLVHYITFVDSNVSGYRTPQATNGLSFNPNSNILTATSFNGSLTGTASASTTITLTSDNTSGTYYLPFSKLNGGTGRSLFIDDTTGPLTYNPSTSTLTATNFTGSLNTTGLVFLQTLTGTITGSAIATTFTFPSIFNTTYKNYKILFTFGENAFTAYPSVSLNGYSGTNVPTTGDIYGYDMTSGALSPVNLANQVLATTPLQMTGACLPNVHIEFDVFNVGYTTLQSNNIVKIVCNSTYNNPGVKGIRNITTMTNQNSSSTITGLSLSSILGVGNNPTWTAKIYGYK
jgi:hypothetical protein